MFHKEKMTIFVNGVEQEIELMPTYQKMFEFVNNYPKAKDIVAVATRKKAVDYESVMQFIYISYLGGNNPQPLLKYEDFLNAIQPSFDRDMLLFAKLMGKNVSANNVETLSDNEKN